MPSLLSKFLLPGLGQGALARRYAASTASQVLRGDYAVLTDGDVSHFESILDRNNVKTTELDQYNVDFMKWYKGKSQCVLLPETAEQVSCILRHCYSRRLAVVPQSGNTGLVGGSVPVFDEVVVSTKKLNKACDFDASAGILECDAGFVLEELDNRLAKDGYMMPIDLGAKGSCFIGGNVATNAGGIRLLRYGSLHANVLGLQAVFADREGTVLNLGSKLRKDNSDIHKHHLFIGSEGQFGIITKVAILAVPRPTSVLSAFLGVETFDKCREILRAAKQQLGEILSSFELLDGETLRCIKDNTGMSTVLSSERPFNLLVETSGSSEEHDAAKMERFLEHCLRSQLASDGILANSASDAAYLWKLRENASLSLTSDGYCYKHDFTLPLKHFYELTETVRHRLSGKVKRVITFGHIGDGNTHLNLTTEEYDQEVHDLLYPFVYNWVAERGGSISAEHGIGRCKRPYHLDLVAAKKQQLNKQLKKVFDPRGILSPYKMIGEINDT